MSEQLTKNKLKNVSGGDGGIFKYYIVRYGDTLASISTYLQVSQSILIKLNNISNPDKIQVGDRLKYPA